MSMKTILKRGKTKILAGEYRYMTIFENKLELIKIICLLKGVASNGLLNEDTFSIIEKEEDIDFAIDFLTNSCNISENFINDYMKLREDNYRK